MPTERPKVLITLDEEVLEQVERFRFESRPYYGNRIPSRSEAVRKLIDIGLQSLKDNPDLMGGGEEG